MKRYLSICLLWACFLTLLGQSANNGYGDGSAPSNPDNPSMPTVKYTFTLKATEGGTVSQNPSGKRQVAGTKINVSASANENYKFVNWVQGDSVVSTNATYSYTMPAKDVELKAVFKYNSAEYGDGSAPSNPDNPSMPTVKYTFTLKATEGGTVSQSPSGTRHVAGTKITVRAIVNEDYKFVNWVQGDSVVSTNATYSYTMPAKDVELKAVFKYNSAEYGDGIAPSNPDNPSMPTVKYTFTLKATEGGTVSQSPSGTRHVVGTKITVRASVNENYKFVNWVQGDSVVSTNVTYSYTMPAKDVELKAVFKYNSAEYGDGNAPSNPDNPNVIPLYYQLSAEASPSVGGSVSVGSSKVQEGTTTYVNASPNTGYQFKGWMCDGELVSTERRYNFTMESKKMHFTALFEYNPPLPDSPSNNPGNVTAYTLTYVIEGQTYYTERVPAGATLTNIGTPVRKGYTFDGWQNVPAVMPASDLTINGTFTVNKYTVTYVIDGAVHKTESVTFGTSVPVVSAPAREGYNFDGWKDMPASMPAEDITLVGTYSVNKDLKYNVIYIVDGKEYKREPVSFDDPVTLLPNPVKEGHTFSGWKGEVPERMPLHDVTITGSFSVNNYTVKFIFEGETIKTETVAYGTAIPQPEIPAKEGYSFSGWGEMPETMPAKDMTFTGSYVVNKYKLIYNVDGNEYKVYEVEYGKNIMAEAAPAKEGHTFSGWSDIPATMPAKDVVVNGAFTVNRYKVTYILDDETFKTDSVAFGATIKTPSAPAKEGHTFDGWGEIPASMPSKDLTFIGSYSVNQYTLTYKVDGKEYNKYTFDFGASITAEAEPTKEGHTFSGWSEILQTMPAKDVVIVGTFTVNRYKVTYVLEGEIFQTDSIAYGATISTPVPPTKPGYNFSGWGEVPASMPANDVTLSGSYIINKDLKYNVIYMVDGKEYKSVVFSFGDVIELDGEPVKEGHTFSGWSEAPATMPLHDVTVTGTFTANTYTVTFVLGGVTFKTESVVYGTAITVPEVPAKEGYTFFGWGEIPATMPAENLIFEGGYGINKYNLVYMVDGVEYKRYALDFGASITAEAEPTKVGHTFSGWSEIPSVMPANDVTVTGKFTVNKYTVTYILDGEVFKTESVAYGADVSTPIVPAKPGYNFSGWENVPVSMPANDITLSGSYIINKDLKYNLIYMVDGKEYKSVVFSFGDVIELDSEPVKEGHTFSGWSEAPATMPLHDVTVTGTFTANTYTVTFVLGGVTFKTESVVYGTAITVPEVPAKEGYTFSGWGEIPATMPAENLIFEGGYGINKYNLVYMVDGVEYKRYALDFGANITAEAEPTKVGHTFSGWSKIPSVMPANDVTVTGKFTVNKYTVTYILDGEVFKTESVAYGAAVATPTVPTKPGYNFSGWGEVPASMPAEDITLSGSYIINKDLKYNLIYMVDGKEYKSVVFSFGDVIELDGEPVKEGHTFSGWSEAPATMPLHDVTVTGTFTANTYTVTFVLGGVTFKTESVVYGTAITVPEVPAKEGYTFFGWGEIPATMPAENLIFEGGYGINKYNLVYMVDGVEYKRYALDFGASITAEAEPTKVGHTFSGWSELPQTMPASDVTVTGTFTVNKYTVTYILDGEVFKTESIAYGTAVPTPTVPTKPGYNFSGWSEVPASMPAEDITITGSYSINTDLKYNLVYMVDGKEYKSVVLTFGDAIVLETEPTKEGHTFSGWSEVPATMPLHDVTVTGTFTANTYTVTFLLEGETFKTESVVYGTAITVPEVPAKEGYTFSGWGNVPSTMPAENLTFIGNYTINKYNLVYMVDGVEYKRYAFDFGASITAEAEPTKVGHTFSGWSEIPQTMPANDVTVTGTFTVNNYTVTYILDGEVFKTESIAYGTAVPTPTVPTKPGYNFSGWGEVPASMPAEDITLTGSYSINTDLKYNLVYMVDDKEYKSVVLTFGDAIVLETEPTKEGHTFSGWSEVPATMPLHDVTVIGTFTANTYTVTFVLEGETFKTESVVYGTAITVPEVPAKEGYTFSGWGEIPATMPAENLIFEGGYGINKYNLVYMVDGVEYKRYALDFGASIPAEAEPTKVGHTFSGWSEIPSVMPANDVTVTGKFTVNKYTVTYILDGEVFKTESVAYGAAVPTPTVPTKPGYNFSGWGEVPASMPAEDITLTGNYSINTDLKYNLVYMVDGKEYKSVVLTFGDAIVLEAEPTKEGHTFSGWSEAPSTMPLHDVTVTGTFTANTYTVTFVLEGETFKTESVTYGTAITVPEVPAKEGYTFSGWGNVPSTMPAENLTFTGNYTINKYNLVYMVDGVEYKRYALDFGASITAEAEPTKVGHTFSGWSEIPQTMPANDVTVKGTFTANTYTVTFVLGGVTFKTESVTFGTAITVPEVPAKEGYTFSGWGNVPSTMPAENLTFTGNYTINKYNLVYMVDGVEYKRYALDFGASITAEAEPTKVGHTFSGWSEIPQTMPASDVTVTGSFTVNKYTVTYILDGEVFKTESVAYGAAVSTLTVPAKDGYKFSGWGNVPETMPAENITLEGSYVVDKEQTFDLIYIVDDVEYKRVVVPFDDPIVPEDAPTKEGHTFSGWSDIPERMPLHDVVVTGSFKVNSYILTFVIGDVVVETKTVEYGSAVVLPEADEKEGHSFGGWENAPETMPADDLTVYGSYVPNSYTIIYMIGGEEYMKTDVVFGTVPELPEAPAKEGHTFTGWMNVPETMPADVVVVNGDYRVNVYALVYYVDGEEYAADSVAYGTPIDVRDNPVKDGYTFSGWGDIPETMPARDVELFGVFEEGVHVSHPGMLVAMFKELEKIDSLVIDGLLNGQDFVFIHSLPNLHYLDIKNVKVVADEFTTRSGDLMVTEDDALCDGMFAGMKELRYLSLPSSVTKVGEGIVSTEYLRELRWNCDVPLTDMIVENPEIVTNMIVYTSESVECSYSGNVVKDGVAENIVLTDGVPLCISEPFEAERISYTRYFDKKTRPHEPGGWESIVLPFDVEHIVTEDGDVIAPFNSGVPGSKPFMLASLTDRGFAVATEIKANVPYILAMPNSDMYDVSQIITGNITFEATPAAVNPTSEAQMSIGEEYDLVPTYERMERDLDVYVLNDITYKGMRPGSAFFSGQRAVMPFEAWASVESKPANAKTYFVIGGDGSATDISVLYDDMYDEIHVECRDGVLYVNSPSARRIGVYGMDGRLVRLVDIEKGTTKIDGLEKGTYIVCKKKVRL